MKFSCPSCYTDCWVADDNLPVGVEVKMICRSCGSQIRLPLEAKPSESPAKAVDDTVLDNAATEVIDGEELMKQVLQAHEASIDVQPAETSSDAAQAGEAATTRVMDTKGLNALRAQSAVVKAKGGASAWVPDKAPADPQSFPSQAPPVADPKSLHVHSAAEPIMDEAANRRRLRRRALFVWSGAGALVFAGILAAAILAAWHSRSVSALRSSHSRMVQPASVLPPSPANTSAPQEIEAAASRAEAQATETSGALARPGTAVKSKKSDRKAFVVKSKFKAKTAAKAGAEWTVKPEVTGAAAPEATSQAPAGSQPATPAPAPAASAPSTAASPAESPRPTQAAPSP
jgi:hypothetical protein